MTEDEDFQETFVMIKPDAVGRNLIGRILKKIEIEGLGEKAEKIHKMHEEKASKIIEKKGLRIIAARLFQMSEEHAEKLYEEHKGKHFYEDLIEFATSGSVFLMVVKGKNSVDRIREIVGATYPPKADEGTIRNEFWSKEARPEEVRRTQNIIHASSDPEAAEREINIFFDEEEIIR